jgi:hypothetical protein
MDARPILLTVARALRDNKLEAILIGNAAAALQGAPVTTVDADFLFRKTPANLAKLKGVARTLGAVVFAPYYPVSGLYRLMRDEDLLQLDFMTTIHGVRSFNSVRSRAFSIDLGGEKILTADLSDIRVSGPRCGHATARCWMSSKRPSKRRKKRPGRSEALEALVKESDLALRDQIRRLLAKPPRERTHFWRKKTGLIGSCL